MLTHLRIFGDFTRMVLQRIAFAAIVVAVLASLSYTIACAAGYAPWLDMVLRFGPEDDPLAGMYLQIGVT